MTTIVINWATVGKSFLLIFLLIVTAIGIGMSALAGMDAEWRGGDLVKVGIGAAAVSFLSAIALVVWWALS